MREPGVPFYIKREVYRQLTTYEYRWIDVRLATAPIRGRDVKNRPITDPPTVRLRRVRRTPEGLAAVREFQALVANFAAAPGDADTRERELDAALSRLDALAVDPEAPPDDPTQLSVVRNSLERVLVTDYQHVYYLNARSTWFSVGKVSTELGKDGSLTRADAETGGGLPELITAGAGALTSFLPVSELLKSKWNLTTVAPGIEQGVPIQIQLLATLQVEEHGYQYQFVRESPTPPCLNTAKYPAVDGACAGPIPADFRKGVFVRTALGGEAKPEEKPAYTVNGRIELPKSDEAGEQGK
jgi:hypothetical protein